MLAGLLHQSVDVGIELREVVRVENPRGRSWWKGVGSGYKEWVLSV